MKAIKVEKILEGKEIKGNCLETILNEKGF